MIEQCKTILSDGSRCDGYQGHIGRCRKKGQSLVVLSFIIFFLAIILVVQSQAQVLYVSNDTDKVLLVIPRLTQIAYSENSFYSYYGNECDESCLVQPLNKTDSNQNVSGLYGFEKLNENFDVMNDTEIDKNPGIINDYHHIILLHEEYATQKIFDAITNHTNVIYLYPNSFYALVSVDYTNNTMSLVQGHGYKNMINGFDWKYDNTALEIIPCVKEHWKFYDSPVGRLLDCSPEIILKIDPTLRRELQDNFN